MQKIFINEQNWNKEKNIIYVLEDEVNHIKNVLKCKINDKIEIKISGENSPKFLCEIINIEKDEIICRIMKQIEYKVESDIYLNIIQGIPKSDKMEFIIEKGTELGVKEFTPLELKRCVVKFKNNDEKKKIERWNKIALAAAKQSKRDIIPKVNNIYNIKNIFDLIKEYDIVLLAYENEKNNSLKNELKKIKQNDKIKIAVIIGPEGGIEQDEIEKFKKYGVKIIGLGNRILRTETASVVIASIIMYELENFC